MAPMPVSKISLTHAEFMETKNTQDDSNKNFFSIKIDKLV
jgi:hypothetical protein